MAIDTSDDALNKRIDSLRTAFDGRQARLRDRFKTYLSFYSPEYDSDLKAHDQWTDEIKASDVGKTRDSYNLARPTVEIWSALEGWPLPTLKWVEQFVPTPPPSLDPEESAKLTQTSRAIKLTMRHESTLREQALLGHFRRGRLRRHYYRTILTKNQYGHSWLQIIPDPQRRTFDFASAADPLTIYPVWSSWNSRIPVAILCAMRKDARTMAEEYPEAVTLDADGRVSQSGGNQWYRPVSDRGGEDPNWVWVEDYWVLDRRWKGQGENPSSSRAVYARRVNGKLVDSGAEEGWQILPYIPFENPNGRNRDGFSDIATVQSVNDALNKALSAQQDVIHGESRPKYKHRSETERPIQMDDDGIIHLDTDEDIEQIQTHIDIYPTTQHVQMVMELFARTSGLNDSAFGRINASQNSGRALAQAWKAVAARMTGRLIENEESLDLAIGFMLDHMELHNWDDAQDLYNGQRDFTWDFPNQEPRDFLEVTQNALNKLNGGIIDATAAMEETGEESPDEMLERIRADYVDPVYHPEKAQSYLLLQREQQAMQLEALQAHLQVQAAQAAQAQAANTPPGGAPGGAGPAPQDRRAAEQARIQAAQQAAPNAGPGTPATQAGQTSNASNVQASTLVQDGGAAQNRIIAKY